MANIFAGGFELGSGDIVPDDKMTKEEVPNQGGVPKKDNPGDLVKHDSTSAAFKGSVTGLNIRTSSGNEVNIGNGGFFSNPTNTGGKDLVWGQEIPGDKVMDDATNIANKAGGRVVTAGHGQVEIGGESKK